MSRINLPAARQRQAQYVKRHSVIQRKRAQTVQAQRKQPERPQLAFSKVKLYETLMGFTATPFKSFVPNLAPKTNEIQRSTTIHYR